jgi:hypothetical protein
VDSFPPRRPHSASKVIGPSEFAETVPLPELDGVQHSSIDFADDVTIHVAGGLCAHSLAPTQPSKDFTDCV